jgi:hypothetical protein
VPGIVFADPDTLDATEVAELQFMREEEKLARDVYRVMFAEWGQQIFANISESEQRHTDAVAGMMEKYGVEDPVTDDSTGVFVDPELQALYDDLVEKGLDSRQAGLMVGALIEEVDMVDLEEAIHATDNPDIQELYGNLLRGSRNHLRAFVKTLEDTGIDYEAQVLSQDEVDLIVSTPFEHG